MTRSLRDEFNRFSAPEKWYLLIVTVVGAAIRVFYLRDRAFIGDEIGTLIYIEKSVPYLLSHFATWLTMNYFLVLEKLVAYLFGKGQFSLGFIPLAAGILTIPLTALLAVRFTSHRVAMVTAALIAVNPFLIEYSAVIRSYSLLAALSLLLLIVFFQWRDVRTYRRGIIVAICAYVLILSHPNGVYPLAALLFIIGGELTLSAEKRKSYKSLTTLALPLFIAMLLVAVSYAKIFPEMLHDGAKWHDTPPTSIAYIPFIFTQYFSDGFYGWLSAALFIAGVFISYKHEKPLFILLPVIFLPMLLISAQGLSHFPWGYARFLIFIIPLIILFIVEGIDFCSRKYFPSGPFRPMIIISLVLGLTWYPGLNSIFEQKSNFPWHHAASFIKSSVTKEDLVLGGALNDRWHLLPYFPEAQPALLQLNSEALNHEAFKTASKGRIFFVASEHDIETKYPSYHWGKIQVIVYTPTSDQSILRAIRLDLAGTVKSGTELAPEFTAIYRNIWDINNKLGEVEHNFVYYNAWIKCFELTRRQRNIPSNLQRVQAQAFLEKLVNTGQP